MYIILDFIMNYIMLDYFDIIKTARFKNIINIILIS